MDVIGPQVDVKRFVRLGRIRHEGDGLVHEALGDLGALHPADPFAQPLSITPDPTWLIGVLSRFESERQELGPHPLEVGQGGIEPVVRDGWSVVHVALSAHVPLAEVTSGIARFLERTSQHGSLRVEPLGHAALLVMVTVAQVGGDLPSLRVLTSRDGGTRWRAYRGVDVELLETNPFLRHAIYVGRLGRLVAEAGEVPPPHVVDEDQNKVWARFQREGKEKPNNKSKKVLHGESSMGALMLD